MNRSTYYFSPQRESETNLTLMRNIDELYMRCPFYGCRKFAAILDIDKDHANRLMRKMGIETIYQKPRITVSNGDHEVHPYLLHGVTITQPNHVWSTDITYIPIAKGFVYLVAVIDWYSRFVLSRQVSNTLDKRFCIESLQGALSRGIQPEIFNTDQGSQFTSREFVAILKGYKISISMDGRGRALDNVFIERLWRSVKYEEIYLRSYENVRELEDGLSRYFRCTRSRFIIAIAFKFSTGNFFIEAYHRMTARYSKRFTYNFSKRSRIVFHREDTKARRIQKDSYYIISHFMICVI